MKNILKKEKNLVLANQELCEVNNVQQIEFQVFVPVIFFQRHCKSRCIHHIEQLPFHTNQIHNIQNTVPVDVDKEKGIAYFSYADIKKAWGDLSTLSSVCVGTGNSSSRIYKIALLPAAKLVDPTDPTDPSETIIKGDINGDGVLNRLPSVHQSNWNLRQKYHPQRFHK